MSSLLSSKVTIRKKSGNLFNDPRVYIYIYIYIYITCVCVCVCVRVCVKTENLSDSIKMHI